MNSRICNLDNLNIFYTSSHQSVLLITVCVIDLIGYCWCVCLWMVQCSCCCCCYLCAWIRLMWWILMERWCALLKAESPEEKGSPCQGVVEPRTCSGPLLLSVNTQAVQTHCVLIIYQCFLSLSFLLSGELCSCSSLSVYSFHVSHHTFDLCLLFPGAWTFTATSCLAPSWRKENSSRFTVN